eukprot:scaffold294163_cov32-Prasinocladus_malaysianus.AAC.1
MLLLLLTCCRGLVAISSDFRLPWRTRTVSTSTPALGKYEYLLHAYSDYEYGRSSHRTNR